MGTISTVEWLMYTGVAPAALKIPWLTVIRSRADEAAWSRPEAALHERLSARALSLYHNLLLPLVMSASPAHSPSPVPSGSNSRHASTPLDRQRAQLEKLLKDPSKPAHIPAAPKDKTIRPAREMMKNVQGSSAGAGSGEFHVYKASRRREYERLKIMEDQAQKVRPLPKTHNGRRTIGRLIFLLSHRKPRLLILRRRSGNGRTLRRRRRRRTGQSGRRRRSARRGKVQRMEERWN